jgi:hypothetical protein
MRADTVDDFVHEARLYCSFVDIGRSGPSFEICPSCGTEFGYDDYAVSRECVVDPPH